MEFGLSDRQLETIIRIIEKYNDIVEVILFGSRAEGTNREASDVDIAVKFSEDNNDIILALKNDFEESSLPFFFDVIDYCHTNNNKLKKHIDLYGKSIFKR